MVRMMSCILTISTTVMGATGVAVPGFEAYDREFPSLLRRWNVPGAAVAVAYKGRIVFARGYGEADRESGRPVEPDTSFRIMSISKPITATLVLKLVQDGKLSLDARVFELLPYPTPTYSGARRDGRLAQITIRHLLNHTGGWVADSAQNPIVGGRGFNPILYQREISRLMGVQAPGDANTIIRYMVGQPLQADPGTVFSYCNHGYLLLGRVIEKITGMTYEQAVKSMLAPLGATSLEMAGSTKAELAADEAAYYDDPSAPLKVSQLNGMQVPAQYSFYMRGWDAPGGWKMNTLDCLRFLLAMDGRNHAPRLLGGAMLGEMQKPQYPASYYGFGWFTKYACSIGDDAGHGGGSWGTKTLALQSANGDWNFAVFMNSLPTSAFTDNRFEADLHALIHCIDITPSDQWGDMTWTTMSWNGWKQFWLAENGGGHGVLADINHDGVPLLLEYASGLNPVSEENPPPASLERTVAGDAILSFRRIPLDGVLRWTIETSDDGREWHAWSGSLPSGNLVPDGVLSVRVNVGKVAYARLRVTLIKTGEDAVFDPNVEQFPAHLKALSVRAESGSGDDVLIVGFLVGGNLKGQNKTIIVRGLGPAMAKDVSGALDDPELRVYSGSTIKDENDNWDETLLNALFERNGLNNLVAGSKDAALVSAFPDGAFTAHVAPKGTAHGVALAEIYDAGDSRDAHLAALSVRAKAGSGDKTLICGFVVGGTGRRKVVVRGLGPSLAEYLGDQYLKDPKIRLYSYSPSTGIWSLVEMNNDYVQSAELLSAFSAVGMAPLSSGSKDAVLVVDLPPGTYAVHLSGADDETGIALVDVYEIP